MSDFSADLDVSVQCRRDQFEELAHLAERVDRFHNKQPPVAGYGLAQAVCAVMMGGTIEEIQLALMYLDGWNFQPRGHGRETRNAVRRLGTKRAPE